jgi:hypothetical protein
LAAPRLTIRLGEPIGQGPELRVDLHPELCQLGPDLVEAERNAGAPAPQWFGLG